MCMGSKAHKTGEVRDTRVIGIGTQSGEVGLGSVCICIRVSVPVLCVTNGKFVVQGVLEVKSGSQCGYVDCVHGVQCGVCRWLGENMSEDVAVSVSDNFEVCECVTVAMHWTVVGRQSGRERGRCCIVQLYCAVVAF